MQPQIFVTGVPEELSTPPPQQNLPTFGTPTRPAPAARNNNGCPSTLTQLAVPTWDTRRPSCLPNDTEVNLRPKLRKLSSYDLNIDDTATDSFDPNSYNSLSMDNNQDLIDNEPPPCFEFITKWLLGDVQYITDYLDRWPVLSFALPLKTFNAVLRTIGAPMFANNPFSGALILTAIIIEAPLMAAWGLSALGVSLIMALILKQPQHIVSSGQITQHGFLLGLLMGQAYQHMPELDVSYAVITLAIAAALSVLLGNALSSWLSQTNLPGLTLPYITIGICLAHSTGYENRYYAQVALLSNTTTFDLQWALVLQGAARGAGQVYGCVSLPSSGLVFAALLLFSPIAFLHGCLGTVIGALCGVLVSEKPYHTVYTGQYCIHSFLSAISLGGFFFVLNAYSTLTSIAGAAFSAFLFHTLNDIWTPMLTGPHVLATLLLLHARIRGGLLKRVDLVYITYPEMHRRLFRPGNAVEDCA